MQGPCQILCTGLGACTPRVAWCAGLEWGARPCAAVRVRTSLGSDCLGLVQDPVCWPGFGHSVHVRHAGHGRALADVSARVPGWLPSHCCGGVRSDCFCAAVVSVDIGIGRVGQRCQKVECPDLSQGIFNLSTGKWSVYEVFSLSCASNVCFRCRSVYKMISAVGSRVATTVAGTGAGWLERHFSRGYP